MHGTDFIALEQHIREQIREQEARQAHDRLVWLGEHQPGDQATNAERIAHANELSRCYQVWKTWATEQLEETWARS